MTIRRRFADRRPRRAHACAAALVAVVLVLAGCGDGHPAVSFHEPGEDGGVTPTQPPYEGFSDPARVGRPYGDTVTGILTFRGNPTRTYHGEGPVPRTAPSEVWRYPRAGGAPLYNGSMLGSGMGFPTQALIFERDGRTWLVFGAWDGNLHFLDADTGERIYPDFHTNGEIKGGTSIDPDGYPLVYVGSRDNYLRIVSFDQDQPVELWKLNGHTNDYKYNDDWDGAPLVIDDYLFEGGENSWFYIFKLNRGYDAAGHVTVNPQQVFRAPAWDAQLQQEFGGNQFSVEPGPTVVDNTVYIANSSGLVQGFDISGLKEGKEPTQVFRFWTGDDTDAAMVADEEGYLYVGSTYDAPMNARARAVGQMMKLDPRKPDAPIVWSLTDPETIPDPSHAGNRVGGALATPALYKDLVIFSLEAGDVVAIDREIGQERWRLQMHEQIWTSPTVVDGVMVFAGCGSGSMFAYDISDTQQAPTQLWTVSTGMCIESSPAIWHGKVYIGNEASHSISSNAGMRAFAVPGAATKPPPREPARYVR